MITGGIFVGIYAEKEGQTARNTGYVKVRKENGFWQLLVDVKGFYEGNGRPLEVCYYVCTETKTYLFPVGQIRLNHGMAQTLLEVEEKRELPDMYRFEWADGICILEEQTKETLLIAQWDKGLVHPRELYVEKRKQRPQSKEDVIVGDVPDHVREVEVRAAEAGLEPDGEEKTEHMPQEKTLMERLVAEECQDIFNDDEFTDCIEITPKQLEELAGVESPMASNSFLLHAFFKYHHLLLARPTDAQKQNMVIIGAPGIYNNRERYLASLFGFRNFKKSHRSDYKAANFGYWYAEMYI